jgi:diguanylate cyclase (GGDEF)-like protein
VAVLVVVFLEVVDVDHDHFKEYNDKHGHDAGDFVLVEMADLVRGKLRSMDIPCRYGGEELVLVMPGASKEIATARAEAVRQAVEQHAFLFRGVALPQVTVSLGVAAHPADGDGGAELLKAADSALYVAKNSGRNRVVVAGAAGSSA